MYLRNTVWVRDHDDNIVKGQQTVALDLCVHVLAHGAAGQQFHKLYVVPETKTVALTNNHYFLNPLSATGR